jgi:hypothetical protein
MSTRKWREVYLLYVEKETKVALSPFVFETGSLCFLFIRRLRFKTMQHITIRPTSQSLNFLLCSIRNEFFLPVNAFITSLRIFHTEEDEATCSVRPGFETRQSRQLTVALAKPNIISFHFMCLLHIIR